MTDFKMGDWLIRKDFIRHSGDKAYFKAECDNLTDEVIETFALIISKQMTFGAVHPVPTGGLRIGKALNKYITKDSELRLIVDDVMSTGASMREAYDLFKDDQKYYTYGTVLISLCDRALIPDWVQPVFQLWFKQ